MIECFKFPANVYNFLICIKDNIITEVLLLYDILLYIIQEEKNGETII